MGLFLPSVHYLEGSKILSSNICLIWARTALQTANGIGGLFPTNGSSGVTLNSYLNKLHRPKLDVNNPLYFRRSSTNIFCSTDKRLVSSTFLSSSETCIALVSTVNELGLALLVVCCRQPLNCSTLSPSHSLRRNQWLS
jgi:hypothetical protein